jgi:diadenosine tetraphosphatase ApaH/serine/threonine PP2A family protein phosphatase
VQVLILSDIHANLEALEACLRAASGWNKLANLGDTVGYGADPNAVIARVRELAGLKVRGNHDRAVLHPEELDNFNPIAAQAIQWTRRALTDDNLQWLRGVPPGPARDPALANTQFVHGSPLDENEYIVSELSARSALMASTADLVFFGHTHIQVAMEYNHGRIRLIEPGYNRSRTIPQRCDLPLDPDARYLINPGSVGQPRDGDWRAGFATYDSQKQVVSFWRVAYDIDMAQQKIVAAGLPFRLASRLREGR